MSLVLSAEFGHRMVKVKMVSYFLQKTWLDISCELSPHGKKDMTFHMYCLYRRQFIWNVSPFFFSFLPSSEV